MTDKTTDATTPENVAPAAAPADNTKSDTPKTDAALNAAMAMIPPPDNVTLFQQPVFADAKPVEVQDHPPGDAKSVFFKAPGGWAKFNRDGSGWAIDPQDFSRYPDDYFDFVGIPVVKSLD